ncbi:MAG TPA: NAD-dependent epimerase/dehydratase family protein [Chitinophagales bacterium]|nr:NAD-dependent epimerase/dehydratase family protein [Chitinophagales bacterium]
MNLITGATGLVGSYLARHLLAKGEKVRAIKRVMSDTSLLNDVDGQIEWVEGDVLDIPSLEEAMEGVTQVYHCAAVISFIPSEVDQMMKVNIEGAANVMNAALVSGVEKMIHVSSTASFGLPAVAGKVIDEKHSDPNINKSFWYFRSKQYGEREAWRAHEEGLKVVVVCPSTIIGAGWWDAEPNSLFPEIYNGLKFYTDSTNGFVDVRDVVACMYQLMKSDISGEKFLLTSENLSFKDVIWGMADAMNVKRPNLLAGKFLRSFAWRMEVVKSWFTKHRPLITQESAALAAIDFTYSNKKIEAALGYKFRPVKQTIADTAAVYLKSRQNGKEFGVFN